MPEHCPFCERISEGGYDGDPRDGVVSFAPLDPVAPGHLLVVPVAHIPDARVDTVLTGKVFAEAARLAVLRLPGGDFNLITSAGPDATQTVQHMHAHIVPRSPGDGLPLPWTLPQLRLAATGGDTEDKL